MTSSYTALLTETENVIAFEFHSECSYFSSRTQSHPERIRIGACFRIGGGERGRSCGTPDRMKSNKIEVYVIWRRAMTFPDCNWWLAVLKFKKCHSSSDLNRNSFIVHDFLYLMWPDVNA